jgi:hypothetical protein
VTLTASTGPATRQATRRHRLRWVAAGCWLALSAAFVGARGVPLERVQVMAWLVVTLALLTAASAGNLRRLLVDWVPLGGLLLAYDLTRGAVDALGMPVQVESIAWMEKALFAGHVPTVWLQDRVYRHSFTGVAWWEAPIALVYVSHFVVPYAVAAWYWSRGPEQWRYWRRRFVGVTATGLAVFTVLPAAPPWMAAEEGVIDPVKRTVARGWTVVGLDIAEQLIHTGRASVNMVAAMPSLHAAYAALVPALFWEGRRPLVRLALLTYPLAMAVVLVLGGEHYVVDVLAGFGLVAGVCWAARRWERRRPQVRDPSGSA